MQNGFSESDLGLIKRLLEGRSLATLAQETGYSEAITLIYIRYLLDKFRYIRSNERRPPMVWAIPTRRQRDALRAIRRAEREQSNDPDETDANACCRHGWAVLIPGRRQYRLTEAGREVLDKTD
jgi:hypothetical protein